MAIVVIADYVVEEVGGLMYGMCEIQWSKPYQAYNTKIPFKLPNPTLLRVATQSMIFALQAIESAQFLNPMTDKVVVTTKHVVLYNAMGKSQWPATMPQNKMLGTKAIDLFQSIRGRHPGFLSVLYIERDKEADPAVIHLDEGRDDDGQALNKAISNGNTMDTVLQKTRFNDLRAREILESGAKCFRRKKIVNKK